jgi:hypothetical protein
MTCVHDWKELTIIGNPKPIALVCRRCGERFDARTMEALDIADSLLKWIDLNYLFAHDPGGDVFEVTRKRLAEMRPTLGTPVPSMRDPNAGAGDDADREFRPASDESAKAVVAGVNRYARRYTIPRSALEEMGRDMYAMARLWEQERRPGGVLNFGGYPTEVRQKRRELNN